MVLPPLFLQFLTYVGASMTKPTLQSLVTVVQGWLFAGRHTLTGALVAVGEDASKHFSSYYRLFAAAQWSLDALGLCLFRLALALLAEEATVPLTLDDTLARKRGPKVFGAGMHHDPLISSRKYKVTNWGHSWVVLAVRVQVPGCPGRYFSLPVLFRLYLNQKAAARWHLKYRTRPELAVELVHHLCGNFPQQRFHAYADATYGGQSVLGCLPANCHMTSRLPLDARLYAPPAKRRPGATGRPRKRGVRLPSPRQLLQQQRGRRLTLHIYARHDKVRLTQTVAHWHDVPQRPLRVVAVEPLTGGRPVQAFYSTDIQQPGQQVPTEYAGRWSIEEAFQGSKSHLGFEQPQGWSRQAVRRTAPTAMLLYSLTVLWFAQEGHTLYRPVYRSWYRRKVRPSFADMLATLRFACLRTAVSAPPNQNQGRQNPLVLLPDTLRLVAA